MAENKSYIELANATINVLAKLADLPFSSKFDLRSLAKNLCNFQDRWAEPIDLPYEMGKDISEKIQIERSTEALKKLHCIYEYKNENGETTKCLAGSEEWKNLISKNELKEEESIPPNENFALWLVDLFELFQSAAEESNSELLLSEIRPLAACWYYHASETSFEGTEENVTSSIPTAEALLQSLILGKLEDMANQNDDEEEDDDEDYDEDDDDEEEEEEEIKEEEKSIEKANGYKEEGNSHFKGGDWENAANFYSLSISFCPSSDQFNDQRAIFFANRAAALLNLFFVFL